MNKAVSYSMNGDIAVVTIDSPPVNAVNQAVRAGLKQAAQPAGPGVPAT